MSDSPPDPTTMNDTGLIFAMGLHDDVCACPWFPEWHRRRGSNPAPAESVNDD
ncbi:hypothetical protein [Spongiactinospora gelatinilytica]|uniref:hypothetical protein n=1 Tax=Spongiactinospora gelatinilytica TaxID=2666298 RepID=UPI0013149877|nr:hypothetical protein [Spongiactinospora gelatinilytica]